MENITLKELKSISSISKRGFDLSQSDKSSREMQGSSSTNQKIEKTLFALLILYIDQTLNKLQKNKKKQWRITVF